MAKNKDQSDYKTGWCMTGHHAACPHFQQHDMGVWEQSVCGCDCHPEGPEWIRRKGPDSTEEYAKSRKKRQNPS